jgi:SAM-dependent methyltransferase
VIDHNPTGAIHLPQNANGRTAAKVRRSERYSRVARRVGSAVGGPMERRIERYLLERAWKDAKPQNLSSYLVTGYQNPVINPQSILARHQLIRDLYGDTFDDLMDQELQWAAEKHQALRTRERELPEELGVDFEQVQRMGKWKEAQKQVMADADRFATRWTEALRTKPLDRLAVIEAACGSANDYRFFNAYGLAPLIDYTGFDLTEANITNARQMFPAIDFRVGDIQDIDAADRSYDWGVAHDLLEHLAPHALERGIDELCRVTRRGVLVSFFRMGDHPEHRVRTRGTYHVNNLSKDRINHSFARHCTDIRWVRVSSMLEERTGFGDYDNSQANRVGRMLMRVSDAWTIIARH